jgi:hypothetical protein
MLPLGCLPLWGKEGVTLKAVSENNRTTGTMISAEPKYLIRDPERPLSPFCRGSAQGEVQYP